MADSKITKKSQGTTSLGLRILAAALLLLVIPLCLHSFFLYREEYRQRLEEVQVDLDLLAEERAHLIAETIQMDWQFLENNRFSVQREGGSAFKQMQIQRVPLPQDAKDRFVWAAPGKEALLVGIAAEDRTALVVPIPFAWIGTDLPRLFSVRISLLDPQGKVFWESSKRANNADVLVGEAPIGETGMALQLTVEKEEVRGLHERSMYLRFASLLFFVGVIGGAAVYGLVRRISRPLNQLCQTMHRVSEGASHARYTPDRMGFEINALGIQFNETLEALEENRRQVEEERRLRERLAAELRIGHEIQAGLLPRHLPDPAGIDIATSYSSSQEVNGDFYDFFQLDNGRILLVVCDTAGKGISACLFSLGLRSMIRALANAEPDLASLVRKINDLYLIDAHESSMFSTVWIGIFDLKDRQLVYCSQGHPPGLLIRSGSVEELWTAGIPLGAQQVDVIEIEAVRLEKGNVLVLYTDGIVEAHNPEGVLFGKKRLSALLLEPQDATAQQIAHRIVQNIEQFRQGAPQHDDMTLVVLRIHT